MCAVVAWSADSSGRYQLRITRVTVVVPVYQVIFTHVLLYRVLVSFSDDSPVRYIITPILIGTIFYII